MTKKDFRFARDRTNHSMPYRKPPVKIDPTRSERKNREERVNDGEGEEGKTVTKRILDFLTRSKKSQPQEPPVKCNNVKFDSCCTEDTEYVQIK